MQPAEAIVAGHICLDIIPRFLPGEYELRSLLEPGKLIEVDKAAVSTGGAVSNTGLALHKLGTRTRLLGKIGDDLWGQAIQSILAAHGADPRGMIVKPGEDTSYTVVISVPGDDRFFLHSPGANSTFSSRDIPWDDFAGARLFHFGYPPLMAQMYADEGRDLVELFKQAKEAGLITSLDMAMPSPSSPAASADWSNILRRLLPYVDLFLPSAEEMLQMLRREQLSIPELSDHLLEMGATVVGLKAGEKGLYLRSAAETPFGPAWSDRELWSACFVVDVVGTTGAGDTTVAGILQGVLEGLGPEATMELGTATGAFCVEAPDAVSGVPQRKAIEERIAGGWLKHQLELPGWQACSHGVWQSPRDCLFDSPAP